MYRLKDGKSDKHFQLFSGGALSFFITRGKDCATYHQSVSSLQAWYNIKDKRGRILTSWCDISLVEWMGRDQYASLIDVFGTFTSNIMSFQKQLDPSYHSYNFLLYLLLSVVDIPEIKTSLRDRIPRTITQGINRVAN